ncbi:hypothetical protein TNCV_2451801 [Trichonephila clavipes]|nr:hypothetical protein TNCV_2451801 [Trichonephila clavipes]
MYKNALKEDLIRVVEDLDGTVEITDTIVKLKTKIENSSTFESDPDFVKTLIKNCIDERETATHIGIREAEDWFRPIDLAKECDIYISSRGGSHSPLVSMKKERGEVPLRTAYSQAGRLWQPKPSSLRAQAQLMRTETVETFELVKVEPKLLREKRERESYSRAFGDGPRHFEPWSSCEDDTRASTPSSNFHITPTGGRWSINRFNVHCPHTLLR